MRHLAFAVLCACSSALWAHDSSEHHQRHQHHHHQSHQHHQHNGQDGHTSVDYSSSFATAEILGNVKIEQCWVRLLPPNLPSAGYFVIDNQTSEPLTLIAAATPSYQHVMLHETIEEKGMSKMQDVAEIAIPAQGTVSFESGGLHAMYEQPTGTLEVGQTMDLELLFADQKKAVATCRVNAAKARSYD